MGEFQTQGISNVGGAVFSGDLILEDQLVICRRQPPTFRWDFEIALFRCTTRFYLCPAKIFDLQREVPDHCYSLIHYPHTKITLSQQTVN
jgi:hypothetical protein